MLLYLFLIFFLFSCKADAELSMERGIQYYEWDMLEKAVLEFKHVVQTLESKSKKLDYSEIKLLSRAHHNLAVSYAKKEWYNDAVKEARRAFDLLPTDENRKVYDLIRAKESSPIIKNPTTTDFP